MNTYIDCEYCDGTGVWQSSYEMCQGVCNACGGAGYTMEIEPMKSNVHNAFAPILAAICPPKEEPELLIIARKLREELRTMNPHGLTFGPFSDYAEDSRQQAGYVSWPNLQILLRALEEVIAKEESK